MLIRSAAEAIPEVLRQSRQSSVEPGERMERGWLGGGGSKRSATKTLFCLFVCLVRFSGFKYDLGLLLRVMFKGFYSVFFLMVFSVIYFSLFCDFLFFFCLTV